ncbi:O-antigen ligase family protein [Enterococcus hirae]|uniref:O-antigen ligase family protein n=1 Tax=Enterococcus hirae TaxID=1354 RepID=UPI0015F27DAD|nr:O-antigen ligase family protein [Enterococcus hirae]EMF0269891.1 O-antigen ligase family protein [Enterococcus hirae]MBA5277319.1 O-antigen ligase family protein [Enterococcus hirae]
MTKLRLNKVILIVFLLMPIIESLNGYYYGKGISDGYRLLLLGLIISYFMRFGQRLSCYMLKLMFITCTLLVLLIIQFLWFHKNQGILMADIKSILRILLAPIYFVFFYEALRSKDISYIDLRNLLLGYSLLYSLLVVIPYLQGGGFVSYDFDGNGLMAKTAEVKGIGCKGYFIELNSLIAILSACAFFIKNMILKFIKKKQTNWLILTTITYILLIAALFITATKLGIVLAFLCSGILIIQILQCQILVKQKLFIVLFISSFLIILRVLLGNLFTEVLSRLDYFYGQSDGNILNVITSNRFSYLTESLQQIDQSGHSLFIDFFGAGYYSSFSLDGFKRSIVEMDWFDLYFSYGIVGFTAYLYFFKDAVFSLFFSKRYEMKSMLLIFFMYSFLGGHIIVNSMTATFLAVCLSYSSDDC